MAGLCWSGSKSRVGGRTFYLGQILCCLLFKADFYLRSFAALWPAAVAPFEGHRMVFPPLIRVFMSKEWKTFELISDTEDVGINC